MVIQMENSRKVIAGIYIYYLYMAIWARACVLQMNMVAHFLVEALYNV